MRTNVGYILCSCSFSTAISSLTKEYSFENNLEIDDTTVCFTEHLPNGQDKNVCKAVLASLVTNIQLPVHGKISVIIS